MAETDKKVEQLLGEIAFEHAFDHIIITDANGKILYCNPAAEALTGYPKAEMIGKTPKLWGGFMGQEWYARFWNTIKVLKKPFVGEIVNQRKDGQKYTAEIRINPVVDVSVEVTHFVGIERDITLSKRIAEMKNEFLSLVSHQLRTPIGQLQAYTDNMLAGVTGEFTPEQQEYIEGMRRSTLRCSRLINNILNVSRLDRGLIKMDLQRVDLDAVIQPVIRQFEMECRRKGIAIIYQPGQVMAKADADKLVEVVSNLIDNALKHTDTGSITITLQSDQDKAKIAIADTGQGIPSEFIPSLFSKDKILPQGPKSNEGARLGLYLAKTFMDMQQGDISVNSAVDKGTTFTLTLPA
jgi:PAS domain S-box-containing protein